MGQEESVKVCDTEIQQLVKIAKCWDEVNEILGKYVLIMDKIDKNAVKGGKIHDALDDLRFCASTYQKYAEGLGGKVKSISDGFVSKIERIDLDLYNEV